MGASENTSPIATSTGVPVKLEPGEVHDDPRRDEQRTDAVGRSAVPREQARPDVGGGRRRGTACRYQAGSTGPAIRDEGHGDREGKRPQRPEGPRAGRTADPRGAGVGTTPPALPPPPRILGLNAPNRISPKGARGPLPCRVQGHWPPPVPPRSWRAVRSGARGRDSDASLPLGERRGGARPRADRRRMRPGPAALPVAPPPAPPTPALGWTDCGDGFQCTTIEVPKDWNAPDDEKITLAMTKMPATGTRTGAVFVNWGGPATPATRRSARAARRSRTRPAGRWTSSPGTPAGSG